MLIKVLTLSAILLKALLRTGCQKLELDDLALTQRLLADDLQVYTVACKTGFTFCTRFNSFKPLSHKDPLQYAWPIMRCRPFDRDTPDN
jgi:hypothetical protein